MVRVQNAMIVKSEEEAGRETNPLVRLSPRSWLMEHLRSGESLQPFPPS